MFIACLATLIVSPAVHGQTAASNPSARVIVQYKTSAVRDDSGQVMEKAAAATKALATRAGIALRVGASVSERALVVTAESGTSDALAARLSSDAAVEYAEPDRRRRAHAPNDPLYGSGPTIVDGAGGPVSGQWYLRAPGAAVRSSVDAATAWAVTTGDPSVVVAVLDTGVRFDHPDLLPQRAGGNLVQGYDFISDAAAANDGDGRDADASDPGDWLTQAEIDEQGGPFYHCAKPSPASSWHGTQTSALVGARTGNGIGMAGLASGVRILPVRVLGKCGGFDSDIIAGMRWAAGLPVPGVPPNATPARVLNLSLGGDGTCSRAYRDAIAEIAAAGALVVASAGNSQGHGAGTPANCPGVIAVSGLRHAGTKVGFSDLGPEISLSAPAGNCVNTAPGTPCLYPILTASNRGATSPLQDADGGSVYTDSFRTSLGTSFSAPLVAGTAALMLSARPDLSPSDVQAMLRTTARPFPTTSVDNGNAPVVACAAPNPIGSPQADQLECVCTTSTCGAGMLDAGAAVRAARDGPAVNYTGLFWNAPAGSESGWGLSVAHQGGVVFATWFTYDATGRPWWLAMTAQTTGAGVFSGTLYQTRGPAFDAVPFDPSRVSAVGVGTATLAFADRDNGRFFYTVNGISQSKAVTRQVFGPLPTCVWNSLPQLDGVSNVQDLWWARPAGGESGWGIHLTQQGTTIFATWFTYGEDGAPLWLTATARNTAPGIYTGTLYSTTGPPFDAAPFRPANVQASVAGNVVLSFTAGNTGTFAYSVNTSHGAVLQTKPITREVFSGSGTACR